MSTEHDFLYLDVDYTNQLKTHSQQAVVAELLALPPHSEDDVYVVGSMFWNTLREIALTGEACSPLEIKVGGVPVWFARGWPSFQCDRVPRAMVKTTMDGLVIGG